MAGNTRFKDAKNKKTGQNKGFKGKRNQENPKSQEPQNSAYVDRENDYSRSLNSSKWRSWHNTMRDIDSTEGEKEKGWRKPRPNRYERGGANQALYPIHPNYQSRVMNGSIHPRDSGPWGAQISSFFMELGEGDFGCTAHAEPTALDIEGDAELKGFLSDAYQSADSLLSTHACQAQERIDKERQLATEKWLMTRTPEERLQYLQRQQSSTVVS